ncbi:MAG TPA: hypothetical protein VM012_08840, partial [Flavitalea sp.]|nr:hypothetical protein [Flavitalea sp.]
MNLFANPSLLIPAPVTYNSQTAFKILLKAILLILLGTLTVYGLHPVIKVAALTGMIGVFFFTLKRRQYFSFIMLLFIASHFVYINTLGGLYNIAAVGSLILLMVLNPSGIRLKQSSFSTFVKLLLVVLFLFQLVSVVGGNEFGIPSKIMGLFVFTTLVLLFYFTSKVEISDQQLKAFLIIVCLLTGYMFLVSLNQKYLFVPYNLPFIPLYDQEAQFEFDITRGSGTLLNFEAYAEYSVSVIALLLPGILTGSLKKWGAPTYRLFLATILISIMAVVISGTRSSMLLLIVLVGMVFFFTRKIRRRTLVLFLFLLSGAYLINAYFNFVDLDVFRKRSADINFSSLSLGKILKGEDINREETFSLALDRIENSSGWIGGGYYSSVDDYRAVHFGSD